MERTAGLSYDCIYLCMYRLRREEDKEEVVTEDVYLSKYLPCDNNWAEARQ